nr:hypothetical protein [Candidatus Sigynarchaeota archaeon]
MVVNHWISRGPATYPGVSRATTHHPQGLEGIVPPGNAIYNGAALSPSIVPGFVK